MNAANHRRLANLEASAPPEAPEYDLNCLTDAELIVLATFAACGQEDGQPLDPELQAELDRIEAKLEARARRAKDITDG
jgi:hypothetical protein